MARRQRQRGYNVETSGDYQQVNYGLSSGGTVKARTRMGDAKTSRWAIPIF
ncbi:hypothetical protein KCP71_01735 [Salmonella enterica subsp. enterica]|nr:hypothetical protein KCP71_01735 [Salmonella enterica subsp. enterica]